MSKTHQVGYAMYLPEEMWEEYVVRSDKYKAVILKGMNRMTKLLWLKPPTTYKYVIHPPGSGSFYDPLNFCGSVGVKGNCEHRWPEKFGHFIMGLRMIRRWISSGVRRGNRYRYLDREEVL